MLKHHSDFLSLATDINIDCTAPSSALRDPESKVSDEVFKPQLERPFPDQIVGMNRPIQYLLDSSNQYFVSLRFVVRKVFAQDLTAFDC
jgi:hypothetical protein